MNRLVQQNGSDPEIAEQVAERMKLITKMIMLGIIVEVRGLSFGITDEGVIFVADEIIHRAGKVTEIIGTPAIIDFETLISMCSTMTVYEQIEMEGILDDHEG